MKSGRFTLTLIVLLVVSVPLMLGSATTSNQGRGSLDDLKDALARGLPGAPGRRRAQRG